MTSAATERVLRLAGPGDLDQLDPAGSPRPATDQIIRLCTRQLFGYRAAADPRGWQAVAPVADLAAEIPSIYNAGLGASYTSYVVHLRPGVEWDTTPPRPVTAHDVVRGLKRLCAPVLASPALPCFTSTIRGMAEFRAGYAAAVTGSAPDPAELAEYQNSHEISGLLVLDDETIVFELLRPALDFITMLALPCASPAPAEYDAFLPGSTELHANLRSNGPYRPARQRPGEWLRLEPNPVWSPDRDPVRERLLDAVEFTVDDSEPDLLARKIRAAEVDLPWGTEVSGGVALPEDLGMALDPYLVFNTLSPVLGDVRVRQAIGRAIDRTAIARAYEELGSNVRVANSIVPPGNEAHQDFAALPACPDQGDPQSCRALLAEAGVGDGLALTAIHPATEPARTVARCCADDLAKAGVSLRLVALGPGDHRSLLENPAGEWDLALASWTPGWLPGNARVFLQPLLASTEFRGTANYGRYANSEVDRLIDHALASAEDAPAAVAAWQEAERVAMADAAIVPILHRLPALPVHSVRVHDVAVIPALGYSADLSTLRLVDRAATKAGLTRVFDRIADDFDRSGVEFHGPAGRRLADYARLRAGESVLDIGCGRGAVTFPAAEAIGDTGHLVAIDLSAPMVDHVVADARRHGLANISARVMDGEKPGFPPGTFDVILGGFSIVMFLNAEVALRRYPALLRCPGRLALSAPVFREDGMPSAFPPNAGDAFRHLFDRLLEVGMPREFVDPRASWFGTPEGLDSALRKAGFDSVRMTVEPVRITMRSGWDWVRWTFAQGARLFWERIPEAERQQLGGEIAAELETTRDNDGNIAFPVLVRYVLATL